LVSLIAVTVITIVVMYGVYGGNTSEEALAEARRLMVLTQLGASDITDLEVLRVMENVPRHVFVDESLWDRAYGDHPLPIGEGQTISQPYVVALMTQSLNLRGTEKVLEIGTGSGYQAAVLAELVDQVYTIEIRGSLAERAENLLDDLGYSNIHVKCADGYFGWKEEAPFDAIMVTCAVSHVPPYLINQLKDGGRLIIPLGSLVHYQTLTLLEKDNDSLTSEYILSVTFVPMIGRAEEY
jgi:protein-L-isoaspartate(D-aspartate) O-methyltransferase